MDRVERACEDGVDRAVKDCLSVGERVGDKPNERERERKKLGL